MKLLPLVEDNEWFFDTELLVTAERLGLRIGEVPVDWVDDPDSSVQIVSTAADDLRGVWRMLVRRPKGLRRVRSNEVAADQLLRFAGVGVVSTLGYLFLFVAWRPLLGAFAANAVAMAIATLFNTAVHRELSRTTDGQARRGRLYAVAGGLYLVSFGLTTLGLVVAQWIDPSALLAEVVALTVANAGRCRVPIRRAPGLDLPTQRSGRRQPDGVVPMTDLIPAPDAAVGLLDLPIPVAAPSSGTGQTTSTPWPPPRRRGWPARFVRGKESDAAWVRPALLVLLAATAVLYIWDLSASGWANSFYSAAVQAGSKSWKAMFFGSSDSSNFITVDKPPAFLWPMEISARIFGLNSWSILVPQALEGVATVGLVYLSVRRWFSAQAALLGGAVVALTPVAAIMFRFNNPDALLALLLTAATYATIRGLERAQTKWMVLAGALIGFGFITKMMQAFLILPVLAVVYLLAAPTGWWRRVWQTFLMGVSLLVAAGWWVGIVALTPAADRPYVGGSQNNSILNLIFGYNGFGRLDGSESGSVGRWAGRGEHVGPDWHHPSVQHHVRQHDVVAPSRRAGDGRSASHRHAAGPSHRPRTRGAAVVGRLPGEHRPGHQPGPGHHPPLLHGRARSATRSTRRNRHHGPLATAGELGRACRPGHRARSDSRMELHPPRPHVELVPCPPPLRPGCRSARRGGDPRPPTAAQHPEGGGRAGRHAGLRRCTRRPALLVGGHRGDATHRGDPVGDAHPRRRRSGPGGGFAGGAGGFPGGGFRRAFGGGTRGPEASQRVAEPGASRPVRAPVRGRVRSRAERPRSGAEVASAERRVPVGPAVSGSGAVAVEQGS